MTMAASRRISNNANSSVIGLDRQPACSRGNNRESEIILRFPSKGYLYMDAPALHVAHGMCYVLLAYDVGLMIDLEACTSLLTTMTERASLGPKHRAPQYFEYHPAPLHIT